MQTMRNFFGEMGMASSNDDSSFFYSPHSFRNDNYGNSNSNNNCNINNKINNSNTTQRYTPSSLSIAATTAAATAATIMFAGHPISAAAEKRALEQLDDAILMIAPLEKEAYLEALHLCPHLVQTESCPLLYVRNAHFNCWSAAERLVYYWKKRKEIFGKRAFLPLNLSGDGAMNETDISHFKRGSIFVSDNNVIILVPSRAAPDEDVGTAVRRLFFIANHVNFKRNAGLGSHVIIVGHVPSEKQRQTNSIFFDVMSNAFPGRVKMVHRVFLQNDTLNNLNQNTSTGQNWWQHYVLPMLVRQMGQWSKLLQIHYCAAAHEVVEKLIPHGVFPSSLPRSMGGAVVVFEKFTSFLVDCDLPLTPEAFDGILGAEPAVTRSALAYYLGHPHHHSQQYSNKDPSMTSSATTNNSLPPSTCSDVEQSQQSQADTLQNDDDNNHNDDDEVEAYPAISSQSRCRPKDRTTPLDILMKQLDEAISLLPDKDTEAYYQALHSAPYLVELESNRQDYLRLDNFDVWKTAQRLAGYWKHRVSIFGDRAFRPLTLTSDGALYPEDVQALEKGVFFVPTKDNIGRSVGCYDTTRVEGISVKCKLRVIFYILKIIMQNPESFREGFVQLFVFGGRREGGRAWPWMTNARSIMEVYRECFPTKAASTHIIFCSNERQSFVSHVFPLLLQVFSTIIDESTHYHIGLTNERLMATLKTFGIPGEGLPKRFGGQQEPTEFVKQQRQKEMEQEQDLRERQQQDSLSHENPSNHHHHGNSSESHGSGTHERDTGDSNYSSDHHQPEAHRNAQVQRMKQAMRRIPPQDRLAYDEGMLTDPTLVERESHFDRFLRFASFDVDRAAIQLARYWQSRRDVFGDRAFLPLNQTGDGALERKDVALLQTGYLIQLPCDANGHAIVYTDGSKMKLAAARRSRLRCAFYLWNLVGENKTSQVAGYQVLHYVSTSEFDKFHAECLRQVATCMPVRLKHFHIMTVASDELGNKQHHPSSVVLSSNPAQDCGNICSNSNSNTAACLNDDIKKVVGSLPTVGNQQMVYMEHRVLFRSQLVERLLQYGIQRNGLPKSLCGGWGCEEVFEWQDLRIRREWGLSIGAGAKDLADKLGIPLVNDAALMLTEWDKAERKRRMNVVHSRRKRERERLKVESLNEKVAELMDEKSHLKQEETNLTSLIARAQWMISSSDAMIR